MRRQINNQLNPFTDENGIIVMAHRGGGGLWPENTMYAFERAANMGVDALEMDIHCTADGELVVIHDPTVDRISDGSGAVKTFSLTELQKLDAGYWWTNDGGQTFPYRGKGIRIPTLEEIFVAFPHLWINIDIKQKEPSIVEPFAQMIREFGMTGRVMAGSFDLDTLADFRAQCGEAATAASVNETRRLFILNKVFLGRLYKQGGQALQVPEFYGRRRIVSKRFVKTAHKRNMAVHVWTVDEEEEMQRLIDMGVDGLITDYPDRLLKLVGRGAGLQSNNVAESTTGVHPK